MHSLIELHPCVFQVSKHKEHKQVENDRCRKLDRNHRATKGHQSNYDLKVSLKPIIHEGETLRPSMLMGITVHEVDNDLLALWWKPLGKRQFITWKLVEYCHSFFMDVTLCDHRPCSWFGSPPDAEDARQRQAGATHVSHKASGRSSSAGSLSVSLPQPPQPPPAATGAALANSAQQFGSQSSSSTSVWPPDRR